MITILTEILAIFLIVVLVFLILIRKFEPYIDIHEDKTILWFWVGTDRKYIILWKNTQ